jgi:N-acetyl-gamma-glutamylphosphate reductase
LATHPQIEVAALSADRKAGQSYDEVFPHLRHLSLPRWSAWRRSTFPASTWSFAPCRTG